MLKRILFAHNGTPAAERALLYVEHLGRVEEAEVIVLHVYSVTDQYASATGYPALVASQEAVANELVTDAVDQLRQVGLNALGIAVAGTPARVILETARDQDVSLIILGARGPSSVKEVLLGDVSMEVLRYSRCPVLLVP